MTDVKDEIIQQLRDQIANLTSPQMQVHHETMRDRFAMAALTGVLNTDDFLPEIKEAVPETIAYWSYQIADAMIQERKGKEHE
jgi:hypothetical protein